MAQQLPKKSTLPGKENQLFKSIIKFYEAKQYKKGLKAAEQILKKYPEHGETLAMKGLLLNCLEKKKEAYDFVRKGVKNDITSHVCWHVFGLLYRSDREYHEAIKCYKNALRNDKDNLQILRDLSLLQVHLRDIEGFNETRRKILTLKAGQRQNWISFAIGAHLAKNYQKALVILDEWETSMENPQKPDFENSEFYLYKNMIIEESGDLEKALQHLDKVDRMVLDKLYVKEKKAEFLLKLNRLPESERIYRDLLSLNPDNHQYHKGLRLALGIEGTTLTETQMKDFLKVYEELSTQHPKSDSVHRIPLDYLTGDTFKTKLHEYAAPRIRKGIPSLFVDLKSLYLNLNKATVLEDLFNSYLKNMGTNGTLLGTGSAELPMVIFWIKYFLAQHYDLQGDSDMALKMIDDCLVHTPTVIELYSTKARILKHAGDIVQSSQFFEKAREMDLADRYLNSKSVIHLLRADNIEKAVPTVALFMAKDLEDPVSHLVDMQCNWFVQELAESHFRRGEMGLALKRFLAMDKHFQDFVEDQFDFHSYCLRKMTLRSYIKMLRFEDNLFGHQYFIKAAKWIIKCYLKLHDNPHVDPKSAEEKELESMSADDKKKFLKKKSKEERKKQEEKELQEKQKPVDLKKQKPVDPDPEGKALLAVADKLAEATKFIHKLNIFAKNDLEVQFSSMEVYMRKKKYLLVLQSLKRAISIAPNDADVHKYKIKFFSAVKDIVDGKDTSVNPIVRDLIKAEQLAILGTKSLQEVNQEFLNAHLLSLPQRAAASEVLFTLQPEKKEEAIKLLLNVDNVKGKKDLKECIKVHKTLVEVMKDNEAAEKYRVHCKEKFSYALYFMTEDEKQKRAAALKAEETPATTDDNSTQQQ